MVRLAARHSRAASCAIVGLVLAVGFLAYLGLHFLEPRLAMTWSFAHLSRHPGLFWLAAVVVAILPPALGFAWRARALQRPVGRARRTRVLAAVVAIWACLATIAVAFYATMPLSIDSLAFVQCINDMERLYNGRWFLTIWVYSSLAPLFRPFFGSATFIRVANSLLGAVSLVSLAGCARRLGETRGEATAITLIAWTAFGTLQIVPGYVDIYPIPLAGMSLYLFTAFRAMAGSIDPLWPLLIAGVGPFFYIGLVLLAPSVLILFVEVLRQPAGWRRLLRACVIVLILAVCATLPKYHALLAWDAFYADAQSASLCEYGFSPTSCLLPLWYMFSGLHFTEVFHLLLLIDGVGLLLLGTCGPHLLAWSWRTRDARVALLLALILPYLVFAFTLDPLFGTYVDWDAYSYGATATALAGGYAFVVWGRKCPRAFGPLLGLALAAALVHLLARFNAMHIDIHDHIRESPYHIETK